MGGPIMRSSLLLIGLLILQPLLADKITLKNGDIVEGDFFGATSQEIRFVVDGKLMNFSTSEVIMIQFGANTPAAASAPKSEVKAGEAPPPAPGRPAPAEREPPAEEARSDESRATPDRPSIRRQPSTTTTTASKAGTSTPAPDAKANDPGSNNANRVLVPRWTNLLVQLNEVVDPRILRDGETFGGRLASPVTVNGQAVFPKGAHVTARVIDKYRNRRPEDRDRQGDEAVTLELIDILHDGERIPIRTDEVRHVVRGSRTARAVESLGNIGRDLGTVLTGGAGRTNPTGYPGPTGSPTPSPSPGDTTRVPEGTVGVDRVIRFTLMNDILRPFVAPPSGQFTE